MSTKFELDSKKIKRERKIIKIIKLIILFIILLLVALYFILGIVYNRGNFTITLDKNLYFDKNLIIYDNVDYKVYRSELYAKGLDTFDNISYKWLPKDIDKTDGSHNGDNYIAYSFYIENIGEMVSDYWYEVIIDDVIKDLDEAIRVRIYKNGKSITYAKIAENGKSEKGTTAFKDKNLITAEHIEDFKPGDRDRYTIVIWLEGSDPECNDNILGGEIKLHMEFNSEFVEG